MPLPINTNLSLLGYSRPGDTVQSKPKQAMIVRMSTETLDALSSFNGQPQLDFEFGDRYGIHIGDTFFPMRPTQEGNPHELYLRAPSAAKPLAPLKLYANITGRFVVERELGEKLQDKIRESTIGAAKQRQSRATILIDTPPENVSTGKKKNQATSSMFRKPLRQAGHSRPVALPTPSPMSTPSTLPSSSRNPKDGMSAMRVRMIHAVALRDRTADELLKQVAGQDLNQTNRTDLLTLLAEVAEPDSTKPNGGGKTWRLKPKSWMDVKPYDWPGLSESDRRTMSTTARYALRTLGIPETHVAWAHLRPPPSDSTTKSATKQEAPRRGIDSQEVREKKLKHKASTLKSEILMKDESLKSSQKIEDRPRPVPQDDNKLISSTSQARKTPGSGFRVGKDGRMDASDSSAREQTLRKPSDPRSKEPADGGSTKKSSSLQAQRTRKTEDLPHDQPHPTGNRKPHEPNKSRDQVKTAVKKRAREQDDGDDAAYRTTKRRKPHDPLEKARVQKDPPSGSGQSTPPTRDQIQTLPPTHATERARFSSAPSKAPIPPTIKPRRRSPIYTSSDEEGETKKTRSNPAKSSLQTMPHIRNYTPRPLPTDRVSLRNRYRTVYYDYLTTFQKIIAQKNKISALLDRNDLRNADSVTDSDGDGEILDDDELETLSSNHRKLEGELEAIRQSYSKSTR